MTNRIDDLYHSGLTEGESIHNVETQHFASLQIILPKIRRRNIYCHSRGSGNPAFVITSFGLSTPSAPGSTLSPFGRLLRTTHPQHSELYYQ
jgi:predicted CxxxxCH...CXXCH cytochrome family protein